MTAEECEPANAEDRQKAERYIKDAQMPQIIRIRDSHRQNGKIVSVYPLIRVVSEPDVETV